MSVKVILDISMMLGEIFSGSPSRSGIKRVMLEYIRYYGDDALAFIRYGKFNCVLSEEFSKQLFCFLLELNTKSPGFKKNKFILGIVRSYLKRKRHANSVLFQLDHCSLDFKRFSQLNIQIVYMVHDNIPLQYPEYCDQTHIQKYENFVNAVVFHSKGVIANSQSSLDALADCIMGMKHPSPPMIAAPLASGLPLMISSGSRLIAAPYFVILSTIEGRKNHLMILQIWRRLVERFANNAPRLVIIGKRGWKSEQVIDLLDRCEKLRHVIIEESACSDERLVTYLRYAQALLFPSFSEGYGLPLVEALSYGVPVIASDIPVFHEIADAVPEYIDPLDGKKWMEMIEEYTKLHSEKRLAQLKRMQLFKPPSWKDHFTKVDAFLDIITAEECV